MYFIDKHSNLFDATIRIVIISFQKGSGKWSEVREKSVKSQGILKWILSGNPVLTKGLGMSVAILIYPWVKVFILNSGF